VRGVRQADRPRRRRINPRRQSARGMVQGGGAGEGRTRWQCDGLAQTPRPGARHRRARPSRHLERAAQHAASAGQGFLAGAGAAGRAQGRRRRSLRAAGASAARRRRRAIYFRRHRLRTVPRHRVHQCRLPPHHAARAAGGRRRPDRAERHARHLSRSRRAQGAGAGRLRGRLAPGGFPRRDGGAALGRRARHRRRHARATGVGNV
jgi:hypothetical protein